VLDEDFAVKVGHGDLVAVDEDQDLSKAAPVVDLIGDPCQPESAGAGQRRDVGAGR
jgi:hypothetical protein